MKKTILEIKRVLTTDIKKILKSYRYTRKKIFANKIDNFDEMIIFRKI